MTSNRFTDNRAADGQAHGRSVHPGEPLWRFDPSPEPDPHDREWPKPLPPILTPSGIEPVVMETARLDPAMATPVRQFFTRQMARGGVSAGNRPSLGIGSKISLKKKNENPVCRSQRGVI
jgi:hypothetical protein